MNSEPEQHQIEVNVATHYIAEQSVPEKQRFVFAYTIRIRNSGSQPARLLTRHWVITDANGKVEEVFGDGVVGKQPYLKPGEEFEYTSGAIIETPVGTMQGAYHLVSNDGAQFKADIPRFTLSIPRTLH